MKKSLLFILCTLISCGLWASPRDAQEAQQLAAEFLHSGVRQQAPAAQPVALTLSHTATQKSGLPAFYVFNRGEDGGFVIVSAESRTHTVLGYADNGHFDANNLPDNLRAWLNGYTEAISYAANLPERTGARRAQRAPKAYTPIAPLCTTKWDQGNPFNLKCPTDNGQRCVTGCVATAAAQVMKFNNYPTTGKGSHSYYWFRSENDSVLLSADFGATTYDWSHMLDNYYSGNPSMTQKNAVATLMSHCGIACDMGYGTGSSGAYMPYMIQALVTYFRYNAGILPLHKDYMSESQFLDGVIADLQAGYPCLFSGRTKSDEGHAFICDGLDANGLVHINWGWGGYCDNYFRVSVLDPEDQGTGGSASNEAYTEQLIAFTNIRPSEGGLYQPVITVDAMSIDGTRFGKNDYIIFATETFQNQGLEFWQGKPVVQVYKNGSLYKTCTIDMDALGLGMGWYYYNIYFYPDFSTLPAGDYEIVPAVKSSGSSFSTTPSPIKVKHIGEYRCQMKVTSDSIILTPPSAEIPVEPEVPTVEYLSSRYNTKNNVVLCMTFDDAPCGDVYFVGTPNNWGRGSGSKEDFANCAKFEALPDYEGWYAVAVPYSDGIQGKPIQAELDGSFRWENQCGAPSAWINRGGTGSKTADISAGYDYEANIAYSAAGCYIYELAYWKKHTNYPCANKPKHNYKVVLFAPDACEDMKPAIIGSFNNWDAGVAMTPDTTQSGYAYYYAVINDWAEGTFKFREASDTDWSNQLQYYDRAADQWKDFSDLVLPEATEDTMLIYDFSANPYYRFTKCEVDYYDIYVAFMLPESTPDAVDIAGSFDGWTGTPMTYYANDNYWYTTIRAKADDNFVIVEHDNWDNHLLYFDDEDNKWYTLSATMSKVWKEDEEGKYIAYNLSDASLYCWSADPLITGTEAVRSDDASAQKILRGGQLFIIRNGAIYSITGAKTGL